MKSFNTYINEWENNAKTDAYWAVLTTSQYDKSKWDKKLFFETGKDEINKLKVYIDAQKLPIPFAGTALDFGCGTGRLTQALAYHFEQVYGVDISQSMISQAKKALDLSVTNIHYKHNPNPDLRLLESDTFDFIYSNIVLQHIATRYQLRYLNEFARLVKVGGWIIVQTPSKRIYKSTLGKVKGKMIEALPYKVKKQILIRLMGNKTKALTEFDFEINVCPSKQIKCLAQKNALELKHIAYTNSCDPNFGGKLEFKNYSDVINQTGYLSPMYFLQKRSKTT